MLTPSVQASLTNARRCFREHLQVGDYCTAGKAIDDVCCEEAAEKLGPKGPVRERELLALRDGTRPKDIETLS